MGTILYIKEGVLVYAKSYFPELSIEKLRHHGFVATVTSIKLLPMQPEGELPNFLRSQHLEE